MEKYSATSDRHTNIQVLGNLCESTKVLASYYLKVKILYAKRPFKNNVLDYIINVHIALMFQKVGLRQR